jgi:glucosyl-dolichyl phosphate glucuronosyltransferase
VLIELHIIMLVSAVVCTHSLDNYPNLVEAVDSLLAQTHREMEVIIAVDGNAELYERVLAHYGGNKAVKTVLLKENVGVSGARNAGIKTAKGDVIAFIDDDAVAEKGWIENLLGTYREYDAAAVGGKVLPVWLGGKPDYLPEELYWLAGITHEGFAEEKVVEVRNTFGPNMSFKKEVFQKAGMFNENLGFARKGTSYIQAEEPEFALRMRRELGKGVIYNPKAVVYHKIPSAKVKVGPLLKRAFYQGYSKALLRKLNISADSGATEKSYLKALLFEYIPRRLKRFYRLSELKKLLMLFACIGAVGLGFVYGYVKRA